MEKCIIRECKEELGITINVKKYVYEVKGVDFIQHFFVCNWLDGKIGTGNKEEYDANRKGGIQIPMFIDIQSIKDLNVVSPPIVKQLLDDIDNFGLEFDSEVKEIIEV